MLRMILITTGNMLYLPLALGTRACLSCCQFNEIYTLYMFFVTDQMQLLATWFCLSNKRVFSLPLVNKSELAIQTVSGDKLHNWRILQQVTALRHTRRLKFPDSY